MSLPRARRGDLLTTKLDDEVVVYDPETKQAHSLNRLAVSVWNHSNGARTVEDLQEKVSGEIGVPIDEAAVLNALRKLERAHLLLDKVASTGPMTRREILRKGGKLGAAAAVTPLIASALVPVAAAAASPSACRNPQACVTLCGAGVLCGCFPTTEGGSWCGANIACIGAQTCKASSECPAGSKCASTCCFGVLICEPACTNPAAPATFHGQGSVAYVP